MDTNEVVRATIIWDLEESLKKKDAEIERLREALKKINAVFDRDTNKAAECREARLIARSALQQKDSE